MAIPASPSDDAVTISTTLYATPDRAFEVFVAELAGSWRRAAVGDPAPRPRRPRWSGEPETPVLQGDTPVGTITTWEPGARLVLRWTQPADGAALPCEAHVSFAEVPRDPESSQAPDTPGRTTITIRLTGSIPALQGDPLFGPIQGPGSPGVLGWFTERIAAPAIAAGSTPGIDEAIRDRRARWPEGDRAREVYSGSNRGPHAAMARAVLDALDPGPDDTVLEVGCGAGVSLLRWALRKGCRVTGLDHSATLLAVAAERNRAALKAGRLRLVEADAARMPLQDREFDRIGMVQVLMLLTDPVAVLGECRRVLRPGGLLVSIVGVEPRYRPTSDLEAYRRNEDAELESLARKAGFTDLEITWNAFGGQLLRCRAT